MSLVFSFERERESGERAGERASSSPTKKRDSLPPPPLPSFSLNPSLSTLQTTGGLLEGFGRLLKFDLKVYVYPTVDPKSGELVTASDLQVDDPGVQKLYDYILERGAIVPVEHYDRELLRHGDVSKLVAESIRSGTDEWEALVPHHVRDQVKSLNLLGYRGSRDEDSEGGGSGGSGSSSGESDGGGEGGRGAGIRKVESGGSSNGSGNGASKSKAAKAA